MKLVRVRHVRCGDYDCVTFVMAPDDWDEDEIDSRIFKAQRAYEAAVKMALEGIPKAPYAHAPQIGNNTPDEMTVGEIRAEYAKRKEAYDEVEEKRRAASRGFDGYLTKEGFTSIWSEEAGAIEVECDWGHAHGIRYDYGNVGDVEGKAMPTPFKLAAALKKVEHEGYDGEPDF